MTSTLKSLLHNGLISTLSYFFARFIAEQSKQPEENLLVQTAALVSERSQQGDVCVDLNRFANKPLFETTINKQMDIPTAPAAGEWTSRLGNEKCVGKPGEIAPLIIEGKRLYLGRLWAFEQQVFTAIEARLGPVAGLAEERLKIGLNRLFPQDPNHNDIDWQKLASALAVSRRFAVISGGPGTGKTTTVVKVLALLLEQDPGMHIKLAAPTGKAAARMVDSIRNRKADIDIEEGIRALIPEQASTIHRLLGFNGSRFRHDGNHPLVVNCLVVDEASMIDLSLMAHMLDALPVQSRIILLGDRDQLASVEAGSMLGDITGHGQSISYSKEQGRLLEQLTAISTKQLSVNADSPAISDAIALLRTSYRFRGVPDIGKLAEYVNNGEGERAMELLRDMNAKQMAWIESEENGISKKALEWAVEQYSQYLQCDNVGDALTHFGQIRIL
ncbi:MAG: exodeoxyribonuclease V subunit alpha, partial [Sedimenticolaceae bacterium]